MTSDIEAPANTMLSRFRQRLFQPWSHQSDATVPRLPAPKQVRFQANIAEFLLISRLRARRRVAPTADVLERAAHIVFITCKNWFAPVDNKRSDHRPRI
ncbi:MAG: hypothetical protein HHJ16_02245 [Polaromonas sp.]|uniref:hypothetical protein n=1 Tax=Polaromonas sp. TaxID=1869339 RepID=UPI00183DD03E|nr:hypothetical protein [Polaromonas sp.]NMM09080.1 hypothetical protein [Polaromonas sp.]